MNQVLQNDFAASGLVQETPDKWNKENDSMVVI